MPSQGTSQHMPSPEQTNWRQLRAIMILTKVASILNGYKAKSPNCQSKLFDEDGVSATSRTHERHIGRDHFADALSGVVQQEILVQLRPGGLLAGRNNR